MAAYPRVLLVNAQPIGRRFATGMTMGNLFRGWPLDSIAQLYVEEAEPDTTVCGRSWRLDDIEDLPMPSWARRRIAAKRRAPDAAPPGMPGAAASGDAPGSQAGVPISGRASDAAKATFRRCSTYLPFSIPPEIDREVAAFGADVIYSVLEERRITGVAMRYAQRLLRPLVPHFMDDWLTAGALPQRGPLAEWARRDLQRKALHTLYAAPVRLAIGDSMAEAYRRRYGCEFLPFANCVDLEARPPLTAQEDTDGVFRFGFIGRLVFGRGDTFVDVVEALESLGSEGIRAQIVVYQHDPREPLPARVAASPVVRLADSAEEALLETAGGRIHAFLHVDTFDHTAATYLRYSLSAKVPLYLAAGVPLFAYGAGELGTMRFLSDQRCAAVVGERDTRSLRHHLREFVRDGSARRQLGSRARVVACERFDARVQREALRRVLAAAALGASASGRETGAPASSTRRPA